MTIFSYSPNRIMTAAIWLTVGTLAVNTGFSQTPGSSSTAVQVEESTGSQKTAAGSAINIEMPRPADRGVRLLDSSRTSSPQQAQPVGEPITLTRTTFQKTPAPVPTALPAQAQLTSPALTPPPLSPIVKPPVPEPKMPEVRTTNSETEPDHANLNPSSFDSLQKHMDHAREVADQVNRMKLEDFDGVASTSSASISLTKVPPGDFLPLVDTSGSSPTAVRGGITIPLRPEELTSKPLRLTVPDVSQTTLTNGIRFYFLAAHDLPRVQVTGIMNAGTEFDPADKVGLADLTAKTIRAGGAAGKSGDDIDRELAALGTSIELSAGREGLNIGMFTLTKNFDKSMKILEDLLLHPDFDQKKFEQQKALAFESLRRENDDPSDISRREFRKIVYGSDNPLARTPSGESLKGITRDDVRKFYDDYYRPSSFWIGIAGDTTETEARKMVDDGFGAWNRPPATLPPPVTVDEAKDTSGGIYFLPKATAQSQIRMGHLGIPRHSPEIYASAVLNDLYGSGGFSSRLMNEIRTKKGYVYGIGGGVFSDKPRGLFAAMAASKARSTVAAIEGILDVTKKLAEAPPSAAEIDTAKRDVAYSFITNFDTPQEALSTHMLYDYENYPPDYLKTYVKNIRAVTPEQVQQAAKDMIHMDRMKIFVIGAESKFDKPLSTLGTVTEWKLPPPVK